ncbi:methyltransferase domain-containing protein [Streptomyces sp. 7-21]|nr:methyltransferase domain-containing protein [Streptomyces sp. 7-21]
MDWDELADQLEARAELSARFVDEAAAWLAGRRPEPVTRVLDAGSGPGIAAARFARCFPAAEIIAADGNPRLLERARARGGGRVTTRVAELPGDLPALPDADLVWASNVVHHLGDQRAGLRALAGRVRPGGVLAVCEGGLPLRCLPRSLGVGRPGLQARLDAANEDWFAAMRAALPGAREETDDWPALLAATGLEPGPSRSFLIELRPPLSGAAREAVRGYLATAREKLADRLDADDVRTLDALLDPQSPHAVDRRPGVFFLTAHTVHTATRPRAAA